MLQYVNETSWQKTILLWSINDTSTAGIDAKYKLN